jgi:hypothetical protein
LFVYVSVLICIFSSACLLFTLTLCCIAL